VRVIQGMSMIEVISTKVSNNTALNSASRVGVKPSQARPWFAGHSAKVLLERPSSVALRAQVLPIRFGANTTQVLTRLKSQKAPMVLDVLQQAKVLAQSLHHAEVTPLHVLSVLLKKVDQEMANTKGDDASANIYPFILPESAVKSLGVDVIRRNLEDISMAKVDDELKKLPLSSRNNPVFSNALLEGLNQIMDTQKQEAMQDSTEAVAREFAAFMEEALGHDEEHPNPLVLQQAVEGNLKLIPQQRQETETQAAKALGLAQNTEAEIDKLIPKVQKKYFPAIKLDEQDEKKQQENKSLLLGKMKELYPKQFEAYEQAKRELFNAHQRVKGLNEHELQLNQSLDGLTRLIQGQRSRFADDRAAEMEKHRIQMLLLASLHRSTPSSLLKDPITETANKLYLNLVDNIIAAAGGSGYVPARKEMAQLYALVAKNGGKEEEIVQLNAIHGGIQHAKAMKNLSAVHTLMDYMRVYAKTPWDEKVNALHVDLPKAYKDLVANPLVSDDLRTELMAFLQRGNKNGWGQSPVLVLGGSEGCNLVKDSLIDFLAKTLGLPKYVASSHTATPSTHIEAGEDYPMAVTGPSLPVKASIANGTSCLLMVLNNLGEFLSSQPSAKLWDSIVSPNVREKYTDAGLNIPIDMRPMVFVATADADINPTDQETLFHGENVTLLNVIHTFAPDEKLAVLKDLVPQVKRDVGIDTVDISPNTLATLVDHYTVTGYPDELRQLVGTVLQGAFKDSIAKGTPRQSVAPEDLRRYLGIPVSEEISTVMEKDEVGQVNGLFAIADIGGGGVTRIEVGTHNATPRVTKEEKNDLKYELRWVNGPVGDMAKDSAQKAIELHLMTADKQYARLNTNHKNFLLSANFPSPTEGPSAGLAMATAAISQVSGIGVRADVAMTGTIDIAGHSGIIGGEYEKILGAMATGKIRKILLPRLNYQELELKHPKVFDLAKQKNMEILPVNNMDEVLRHALVNYDELNQPLPPEPEEPAKPTMDFGDFFKQFQAFLASAAANATPPAVNTNAVPPSGTPPKAA
jgi:ATP-dependent Lon protease